MRLDEFVEGGAVICLESLPHGSTDPLFKQGSTYACIELKQKTILNTTGVKLVCEPDKDGSVRMFVVRGWAMYFGPSAIVAPTDPDGELYDAFRAGAVTAAMLASYQQRHNKPRPEYMN